MPRPTAAEVSTNAQDWAEGFSALGHPARVQAMLELVSARQSFTALARAVGMTRGALSPYLRVWRQAGLVVTQRQGGSVMYGVSSTGLEPLKRALSKMQPKG